MSVDLIMNVLGQEYKSLDTKCAYLHYANETSGQWEQGKTVPQDLRPLFVSVIVVRSRYEQGH